MTHRILVESDSNAVRIQARIRVNVLDTNDNAPVFENFRTTFRVSEGAKVMTVVATLNAVDRDQGEHGRVLYEIANDRNTGTFYVDQNVSSGVCVALPLDRQKTFVGHSLLIDKQQS